MRLHSHRPRPTDKLSSREPYRKSPPSAQLLHSHAAVMQRQSISERADSTAIKGRNIRLHHTAGGCLTFVPSMLPLPAARGASLAVGTSPDSTGSTGRGAATATGSKPDPAATPRGASTASNPLDRFHTIIRCT